MNNIKILKNYILYFLLMILICIIGITDVCAAEYYMTYNDEQIYYDNSGSSVSSVGQTWNSSFNAYVSNNITTNANSYGALVTFNSPIPLLQNHIYSLSISFEERLNISLSSKSNISVGQWGYLSRDAYTSSTYNADTIVSKVLNSSILQYAFKSNINGNFIALPWTTTSNTTQTYVFTKIIIEDLGSEGISESTINNSLNNQTTIINNSISSSTNSITQNDNNNRDLIINNQNENTQQQIQSQQVCTTYDNTYATLRGYINASGEFISDSSSSYSSNFIGISSNDSIKILRSTSGNYRLCFYDDNKSLNSCIQFKNYSVGSSITIPNGSYYIRYALERSSNAPRFELCKNGNQALNDNITDLNDSLNDDDSSGASSEASEFFSSFTTNTFGLTSIITAPLNLIQSLTSLTCSELHLPLPYLNNKYLDLPCMTSIYQTHFGAFFTMYQTITYGIIAYWVIVRIFNQVKDFKNPEHDEIEVVDL